MQYIYARSRYLLLSALLLCMPLSCSASQIPSQKAIVEKYLPRFEEAMKVYVNTGDLQKTAAHKAALKEIKSYLEISPKEYTNITSVYVYGGNASGQKNFPRELLVIIVGYIKTQEDEVYYQLRKKMIVQWGIDYCYYNFCVECIVEAKKYGPRYTSREDSVLGIFKHYLNENKDVFANRLSTTFSGYSSREHMKSLLQGLLEKDNKLETAVVTASPATSAIILSPIDKAL